MVRDKEGYLWSTTTGILANKLLRKKLQPYRYYEVTHTPGLRRHVTRPVQFSLVVGDFGVKYGVTVRTPGPTPLKKSLLGNRG